MTGTHLTLRLVRFAEVTELIEPVHAWGGEPLAHFTGADARAAGFRVGEPRAHVWLSCAIYADEAAARAAFTRDAAGPPWMQGSTDAWCGLLEPVSHRGKANWFDRENPGELFTAAAAPEAAEPIVVLTTAGWQFGPGFEPQRVLDFGAGVVAIRDSMADTPGLRAQHTFAEPPFIGGKDAVTLTFRDHARAMLDFAYRPGEHRRQMEQDATAARFDRGSFTRLRALETRGSWHGQDLLATR